MRAVAPQADPFRVPARLPFLLVAVLACAAVLAAPAAAGAGDSLARAHETGRISGAAYSLERARALLDLGAVRWRHPGAERPDAHDVTGILRDLRAAVPLLRADERREAERILARPSDGSGDAELHGWEDGALMRSLCSEVCLHWVETGPAAPPLADADGSGTPDWVERSLEALDASLARFDALGYRRPRSDLGSASPELDARLDVYLGDLGRHGFFGYCTSDDGAVWHSRRVSAYCVLDDDYLDPELRLASPLAGLRATAAHELFHAVQFNYDWLEDLWLMEGTATWMEDVAFPGVRDSLRYLRLSPVGRPHVPLDVGRGGFLYGTWIFWRYVAERLGPRVVRETWERAGRDEYSLAAARRAVHARGLPFPRLFSGFAAANRVPRAVYREGHLYPRARAFAFHALGASRPDVAGSVSVAHLASKTIAFRPLDGLGTSSLALEVSVGPGASTSRVTALVVRPGGVVERRRLALDAGGVARAVVPFGFGVRRVDLVLVNAGTSYRCWRGTELSCRGVSLDDGRAFTFRAALRRAALR